MEHIKSLVDRYAKSLVSKKNVNAVAVGKKWTDGKPTDEDALLVFVEKKEDISKLNKSDLIPNKIESVKTDVVGKTGKLVKLGTYVTKERPVVPGISCGHLWTTAGTIGGAFLNRHDQFVILSNNHVLAVENRGKRGHLTIQPGQYDRGSWRDRIGLLHYYRGLGKSNKMVFDAHNWRKNPYNVEDSATCLIDDPDTFINEIKDIGAMSGWNDNPTVDMAVQKTGRTTGHTTGNIIGLNATVFVQYDMGVLEFRDQIITGDMSAGGDSGSLLLDMSNAVVGLLFAGSNTITIHNPIKYPRATYGLKMVNTVSITENLSYTITEDSQQVAHNYTTPEDLALIVQNAQNNARNGITTSVTVQYDVSQDS
jgi:hypothetical protein